MENKKKVLLVEDDSNFGSVMKDYLTIYDYEVVHTKNGIEGLDAFKKNVFDICIFDVMMPQKDGFTLAKEVREINAEVPIIFLTAKAMKEDILKGYKVGGDDYLIKPFDSEVLLFKIRAIIDRKKTKEQEVVKSEYIFGKFKINTKFRTLAFENEEPVTISPKECALLRLLIINKEDLMTRDMALSEIWKDDNYFTSRSMDVYITKIRKLIKRDPSIEILNVHGEGFRLVER